MDLQYITRKERDDDGRAYDCHYLCDMESARVYGYVEEPAKNSDQFMFLAHPYFGGDYRRYLNLKAAKEYLESCAAKAEMEECVELQKSITSMPRETEKKE